MEMLLDFSIQFARVHEEFTSASSSPPNRQKNGTIEIAYTVFIRT